MFNGLRKLAKDFAQPTHEVFCNDDGQAVVVNSTVSKNFLRRGGCKKVWNGPVEDVDMDALTGAGDVLVWVESEGDYRIVERKIGS